MKLLSPFALIIALVVAGLAPAGAQQGGSYMQTCNNVRQNGNRISASCRNSNGGYQYTQLNLPCNGDIANNNGYLVCSRGGYGGGGYGGGGYHGGGYGNAPGGSYQSSCRGARMQNGNVLYAQCQATNGYYNNTSLNVGRCRPGTDIANINGQLACLNYR
jgi:hypothetical protein